MTGYNQRIVTIVPRRALNNVICPSVLLAPSPQKYFHHHWMHFLSINKSVKSCYLYTDMCIEPMSCTDICWEFLDPSCQWFYFLRIYLLKIKAVVIVAVNWHQCCDHVTSPRSGPGFHVQALMPHQSFSWFHAGRYVTNINWTWTICTHKLRMHFTCCRRSTGMIGKKGWPKTTLGHETYQLFCYLTKPKHEPWTTYFNIDL